MARTTTVTATAGHPFWVPSLREWVDAGELKPRQWLETSSGTWIQIGAVEAWTAKKATVHNLTVTDVHTYYVEAGNSALLVHSCDQYNDLIDELRAVGLQTDPKDKKGLYRKVGRGLENHSNPGRPSFREGEWPKPEGKKNPDAWNALGSQVQDEILDNVASIDHYHSRKYQSDLLDVRGADGRGIRYWSRRGKFEFMGFLDAGT
ncbi:polymorphic toxin-type HINT domain-containing protein [Streptomyces sp. NPDC020996]|uniref:polymorphic toxin-type HINT domain-containing protein n=1 Tax=Streptomyces sp. NPDC020996 TaxID=3154791 RepID=UPI0033C285FC